MNLRFAAVCLGLGLLGCGDDGGAMDAGVVDAGMPEDAAIAGDAGMAADGGAREDAGSGLGDAGTDAGMPPVAGDVPGGAEGSAPVVGCMDALRPARRFEAPEAVCDAVGGGRCWYASPGSASGGDGSFERPFRQPQEAVRRAEAGDIVYLRGGVYGEGEGHISRVLRWDDESAGVVRALITAGSISLPTWAGRERYDVATGSEAAPIVVRSFPGERACSDGAGGIRLGSITTPIAHWRIEGITIKGAPINVGGGSGSGETFENQTHDIELRHNEVYDWTVSGGDNPGLIRVNRGDWGGPERVLIRSNILHDLVAIDPDGEVRDWSSAQDFQHFGAVTALSCETYLGAECGGNGELRIENNFIFRTPQAFFFKNPSRGPFLVRGNVIRNVGHLGHFAPSNVLLEENTVFGDGTIGRIRLGGSGGPHSEGVVFERMGHNLVLRRNTLVGVPVLVAFVVHSTGHTAEGNVVSGLLSDGEQTWDNPGVFTQANREPVSLDESEIAAGNTFDGNCYVTDHSAPALLGRRYPGGVDYLSLQDVRDDLGYERTSVVAPTAGALLGGPVPEVAPAGGCAGYGATLPAWAAAID